MKKNLQKEEKEEEEEEEVDLISAALLAQ